MSVQQLSQNVYHIQTNYVRVFVLEDFPPGTTTLVDTGLPETADYLVNCLDAVFGGVDRIILTHDGGDHYGGLDAVVEAFGPELYASPSESMLIETVDHEIDVQYEDGDILTGGIEVIQVPGHSPAPSALLLRDEKALISGDILDGADRRGLPKGFLLPPPAVYNDDHEAAERGLHKLLDYEFDTVYVFHGSHVYDNAKRKLNRFLQFKHHYRQELIAAFESD